MPSDVTAISQYTKGNSNIKGNFIISSNDPISCQTNQSVLPPIANIIQELPVDMPIINTEDTSRCGCDSRNMTWFYPMDSDNYGNVSPFFNGGQPFGYKNAAVHVSNYHISSINLIGDRKYSSNCGFTHLTITGKQSKGFQVYDIRGGVYQPIANVTAIMSYTGTMYSPKANYVIGRGASNSYIKYANGNCILILDMFANYGDAGIAGTATWNMSLNYDENVNGLTTFNNPPNWIGTFTQTVADHTSPYNLNSSVSTPIFYNELDYFGSSYGTISQAWFSPNSTPNPPTGYYLIARASSAYFFNDANFTFDLQCIY